MARLTRKYVAALAAVSVVTAIATLMLKYPDSGNAPAPQLNTLGASAEQGEYLARAGNCSSCHTTQDNKPYAGGVEFKTPFGTLYSTNISSDKETGIGAWSFADFYRSMKHGIRPDGSHLYPAFPYTAFAKLSDTDIGSLYLYLQTLAPVNSPAPLNELNFPFNWRPLLSLWKGLFHNPEAYVADNSKSEEWNRGAYLVEGPGHCGACHTPRNLMGAEQAGLALTGGVYLDKTKLGHYRSWSAVNLTPADTGLSSWSADDISGYLKTGLTNRSVVHGPMNEVILNSTSHLTESDTRAIATYLQGIPANSQPTGPAPDAERLAEGEVVYTVHCGSCHLPDGLGDPILGLPLAGNAIVNAPDPSSLINVILYGPHLPPAPFIADRSRMKMMGKRLSDADVAAVSTYLRNSFGNRASAVTPQQVNIQR
ncbi:cytochrome c [Pseudomaricurvus sp. HS19]|uniref:c-type cytochrome n=1 Tax=Pseudomaricurvus sp. HS19 TaxID=2692626 RepID=UPI00136B3467|nr:cytochrome c [Pseudomaricurvus sp. HS19]MYM62838.1 c-type cytochrome [Pseudomaricurvus sp. HS19]